MSRVVVVGALSVELLTIMDRLPAPGETVAALYGPQRSVGGRGVNQALAARVAGADVVMVGSVGDDDLGRACTDHLDTRGVRTRLTVVQGEATGQTWVLDGSNEGLVKVILPGANGSFQALEALEALDWVTESDVVIVSSELPLPLVVAAVVGADARGARIVVSCAPYADLPTEVVDLADPLVVNEQGAAALADGQMLPRSLVVTFGPAGSTWDGERAYAAVLPESAVVDSTGAGDAFCGTLAAALADGADRQTALLRANRAGAACVQRLGPWVGGRL